MDYPVKQKEHDRNKIEYTKSIACWYHQNIRPKEETEMYRVGARMALKVKYRYTDLIMFLNTISLRTILFSRYLVSSRAFHFLSLF